MPSGYLTLKQAWWLAILLLLWQFPAALPAGLLKVVANRYQLNLHGLPELIAYTATFALAIRSGFGKRGNSRLAWTSVTGWIFPLIAIGTVALGILIEPITSALPVPEWLDRTLKNTFTKDMIWLGVIFAPILEEILLRGIILDGLLKRYSPAKAIIWSAIIFGLIHLNPAQTVGAFILGLPLGWLYYRTKSLWPCIFLHFVNNSMGSITLFFDDTLNMSANTTRDWLGNDAGYVGLLLLCVLISGVVYQALNRMLPNATLVEATSPQTVIYP